MSRNDRDHNGRPRRPGGSNGPARVSGVDRILQNNENLADRISRGRSGGSRPPPGWYEDEDDDDYADNFQGLAYTLGGSGSPGSSRGSSGRHYDDSYGSSRGSPGRGDLYGSSHGGSRGELLRWKGPDGRWRLFDGTDDELRAYVADFQERRVSFGPAEDDDSDRHGSGSGRHGSGRHGSSYGSSHGSGQHSSDRDGRHVECFDGPDGYEEHWEGPDGSYGYSSYQSSSGRPGDDFSSSRRDRY